MPNLRDLSLRQATSLLETYGMKVGSVITVPSVGKAVVEQYYKGYVIAPGEKIPQGSVITLQIGNGKGNNGNNNADSDENTDEDNS
jgi:beta-lactam-binding protein with PASTA domain